MILECYGYGCDVFYEYSSSDAETKSMFCSKTCEEYEMKRLAEGNEFIAKAKEQNPEAFAHLNVLSKLHVTHPQLFTSGPDAIIDTVDKVFENLGLQTSKNKKEEK